MIQPEFVLYGVLWYATRMTKEQCRHLQLLAISNLPLTGDFSFYEFRHTGTGSSTTTSIEIARDIQPAEILIIGGGGGGGGGMHRNRGPGGGGAGRLL